MLTFLNIRNFKSIGDSGIELRPKALTLLMGPNGSGKSTILEAVCLLSQSLNQTEFVIRGPLVRYETQDSIFHKRDQTRTLSFTLGFTPPVSEITEWPLTSGGKAAELAVSYTKRMNPLQVIQSTLNQGRELLTIGFSSDSGSRVQSPPPFAGAQVSSDARFVFNPNSFYSPQFPNHEAFRYARSIVEVASAELRHAYFLSAVRGDPDSFLDAQTGSDPTWVGPRGESTPHILAKFFALRENQEKERLVVKWAEELGLATLKAGWQGGVRLDSDYKDPVLDTYLRTPLASYGARQVLSILTQLFASPSGSLLMIEEPEISLHPESQMMLPELFAEAIQRGVQVLITTHSIFLPLSLWRPVASGSLKPEQVAVYHATKEKEGTRLEEIPITKEGFLAKWVPSFTRAEEKSIKDLLKLAPQGQSND